MKYSALTYSSNNLDKKYENLRCVTLFHPLHGKEVAIFDVLTFQYLRESALSFLPQNPIS